MPGKDITINNQIEEAVLSTGYDAAAFASVRPFGQWRALAPEGLVLHADVSDIMPEAKGIVLMFKKAIALTGWKPDAARIAPYYLASNRGEKLENSAAEVVRELGYRAVETHGIPMKPAAVRSGAGLRGVNGLFCHERFGAMLSIHALLTDAPVIAGDEEEKLCGECGICQSVCPTGALMGDSRLNRPLCLREHMMRDRIAPRGLRELMGNRLLGCELCQSACPSDDNRLAETVTEDLNEACMISRLLPPDHDCLAVLASYIGSNYARKGLISAQAALCAGNSGDQKYAEALERLMFEGVIPAARAHAAWALAKIAGKDALEPIQKSEAEETSEAVKTDMQETILSILCNH